MGSGEVFKRRSSSIRLEQGRFVVKGYTFKQIESADETVTWPLQSVDLCRARCRCCLDDVEPSWPKCDGLPGCNAGVDHVGCKMYETYDSAKRAVSYAGRTMYNVGKPVVEAVGRTVVNTGYAPTAVLFFVVNCPFNFTQTGIH